MSNFRASEGFYASGRNFLKARCPDIARASARAFTRAYPSRAMAPVAISARIPTPRASRVDPTIPGRSSRASLLRGHARTVEEHSLFQRARHPRVSSTRAVTEPSRSSIDDEVEALASKRDDAQAALRDAQDAYAEACARRDGRVSSESEDEADILFNASPYVDVRCEYGYIQSNAGLYIDISKTRPPGVPRNALELATENFARELEAMKASFRGDDDVPGNGEPVILANRDVSPEERELMSELRDRLNTLTLSNDAIWERERARPEVPAPWIIKAPYLVLCYFLDFVFPEDRPIQRFWFLETVARMPYFSYNTMLTMYELFGWWRRSSELRRVHFAEEWNEYHHLLIHESLGGDTKW